VKRLTRLPGIGELYGGVALAFRWRRPRCGGRQDEKQTKPIEQERTEGRARPAVARGAPPDWADRTAACTACCGDAFPAQIAPCQTSWTVGMREGRRLLSGRRLRLICCSPSLGKAGCNRRRGAGQAARRASARRCWRGHIRGSGAGSFDHILRKAAILRGPSHPYEAAVLTVPWRLPLNPFGVKGRRAGAGLVRHPRRRDHEQSLASARASAHADRFGIVFGGIWAELGSREKPMVRRLAAGGKGIRTIGPPKRISVFRKPPRPTFPPGRLSLLGICHSWSKHSSLVFPQFATPRRTWPWSWLVIT